MPLPFHPIRTPPAGRILITLGYLAVAGTGPGFPGSSPLDAQEPADSVRIQLQRLQARIDSLEVLVRQLQAQGREEAAGDALARLQAAARQAAEREAPPDTAEDVQFAGRQRNLRALNPEISVNVDFFGHLNTDDANDDNFVPREFEFSFQTALDPFSRAKIYVTHHAEGPELAPFEGAHAHQGGADEEGVEEEGHGGEVAIEEGYAEWVGLPGGFSLKAGRFFQRFGTLNRWHAHALPFQSRSLPHLAFLGEESLAQAGASVSWLLPVSGAGTYDATVELTRSSNESLFGRSIRPSVLGHLNGFWQMTTATDLDLGLSWINGSYEDEERSFDRSLYGAEAALTWRPPESSRHRGFVFRGGAMLLDGLVAHEEDEEEEGGGEAQEEHEEGGDRTALGLWSLAELRLSQQWLVGARFDWTENPADPDETAWLVSPTLTWWQSEWVRLRLEYDLLGRSSVAENEGRLWLQVTFAMGPHKHETY